MSVLLSAYSQYGVADPDTSIVVLFGDSISLGHNDAYVAQFGTEERQGLARQFHGEPSIQLSALLNNSSRSSFVLNDGWGGTASGDEGPSSGVISLNNGLSRINNDLIQIKNVYPENDFKDFYALIIYGTNDYAFSISPSSTGFNNRLMINAAKNRGYVPLVGTIPPCSCQSQSAVNSVNSNIAAAASSTNTAASPVYFVDHYSKLWPNWNNLNDDGVHPNNAGYLVMAENWFDTALESLIAPPNLTVISPILQLLFEEE